MRRQLSELGQTIVRVGVLNPDAERIHPLRNRLTIGAVARIQEYGSWSANVPERSFLRVPMWESRQMIAGMLGNAIRAVLNRTSPIMALNAMGEQFKLRVVERILKGDIPPANAPYTVDKKGHDQTLQDTMTLSHSISHDISRRDGGAVSLFNTGGEEE